MRENRMLPIGANTFRIFVDSGEGGEIRGKVSGGLLKSPMAFSSWSRMVLLLEEQLDVGSAELPAHPEVSSTPADFELDILFRQNYSWQGRLRMPQAGKEATFRSVLELLILMETALAQ